MAADFAVDIASQKYIDHMPLERQVRTMKRLMLNVKSQTLWDQIEALAKHLEPSYLALHAHILSKEIVGIDTTSWPKLMKKKRGTTPWQMWCLTSDDGIFHAIRNDKGTETCNALLSITLGVRKSPALFLTNEKIWLDNNLTERSLRGTVIGRKNHYGSKSVRGTEVAAIFYSLVETCKHVGINPKDYLIEAATRAIRNPGSVFLPHEMLI